MFAIRVDIIEWIDDAQPGVVACRLIDASGREHTFIDKAPIFTSDELNQHSTYPQPGWIACELVSRRQDAEGRTLITVDTEQPWHVTSADDITRFEVLSTQIHTIEDTSHR
jgi:hypothetical protein